MIEQYAFYVVWHESLWMNLQQIHCLQTCDFVPLLAPLNNVVYYGGQQSVQHKSLLQQIQIHKLQFPQLLVSLYSGQWGFNLQSVDMLLQIYLSEHHEIDLHQHSAQAELVSLVVLAYHQVLFHLHLHTQTANPEHLDLGH